MQELDALFFRWNDAALTEASEDRQPPCDGCPPIELSYGGSWLFHRPAPAAGAAVDATVPVREAGPLAWNGHNLFVLRDNHVFAVRAGDGRELALSGNIDLAEGECTAGGYDELLATGSTIIAVGRGCDDEFVGTAVVVIDVGRDGGLTRRATYQLGHLGYRTDREYTSRLVGGRLVFYASSEFYRFVPRSELWFPTMRRVAPGGRTGEVQHLLAPARVFRTPGRIEPLTEGAAFHIVWTCDPSPPDMRCESKAVLSWPGEAFTVTDQAVLVWATPAKSAEWAGDESMLVRIPLDLAAPTALRTSGHPFGNAAFHPTSSGALDVFVRLNSAGGVHVRDDLVGDDVALLRVSQAMFSDGNWPVPPAAYRPLPQPGGPDVTHQFVGQHLLYGGRPALPQPVSAAASLLQIVDTEGGPGSQVPILHPIERIDAAGADALIIGASGNDLHVTALSLTHPAVVSGRHVQPRGTIKVDRHRIFFGDAYGVGLTGVSVFEDASPTSPAYIDSSDSIRAAVVLPQWPEWLTGVLFFSREPGGFRALVEVTGPDGHPCALDDTTPFFLRHQAFVLRGCEIIEVLETPAGLAASRRLLLPPAQASRQQVVGQ